MTERSKNKKSEIRKQIKALKQLRDNNLKKIEQIENDPSEALTLVEKTLKGAGLSSEEETQEKASEKIIGLENGVQDLENQIRELEKQLEEDLEKLDDDAKKGLDSEDENEHENEDENEHEIGEYLEKEKEKEKEKEGEEREILGRFTEKVLANKSQAENQRKL